jgi:hypothetical protein
MEGLGAPECREVDSEVTGVLGPPTIKHFRRLATIGSRLGEYSRLGGNEQTQDQSGQSRALLRTANGDHRRGH